MLAKASSEVECARTSQEPLHSQDEQAALLCLGGAVAVFLRLSQAQEPSDIQGLPHQQKQHLPEGPSKVRALVGRPGALA
mmetsp:Transcript_105405/g.187455  ORF Transcript_105405/g.187455 Transcript_105405/m.187455 type:complete len:80 (-) Transcript_105405:2646-2885(-)